MNLFYVMPIVVATLFPLRMAHRLLEPPKWQEITRRLSRDIKSAVRWPM